MPQKKVDLLNTKSFVELNYNEVSEEEMELKTWKMICDLIKLMKTINLKEDE